MKSKENNWLNNLRYLTLPFWPSNDYYSAAFVGNALLLPPSVRLWRCPTSTVCCVRCSVPVILWCLCCTTGRRSSPSASCGPPSSRCWGGGILSYSHMCRRWDALLLPYGQELGFSLVTIWGSGIRSCSHMGRRWDTVMFPYAQEVGPHTSLAPTLLHPCVIGSLKWYKNTPQYCLFVIDV